MGAVWSLFSAPEAPGKPWKSEASSVEELQAKAATAPQGKSEAFSLDALKAEIEELRLQPPAYVSQIGELALPSVVCNEDSELVKPSEEEGPWDLVLAVSGKQDDDAYGHSFRLRLRFRKSWPDAPALVRFLCVFHHALTDENEAMVQPFYRSLERNDAGQHAVRLTLKGIHDFLADPLQSWGMKPDSVPMRLKLAVENNRKQNADRFSTIKKYAKQVKHPDLFLTEPVWKDEWFAPEFLEAMQTNSPEAWRSMIREELPGEIYSFEMFTSEFCDKFVEEIFNFYASGLPARRPNSMNNYGIILNEIGLEPMIDSLQRKLQPIGDLFFPGAGNAWDGHHCFIVRYRENEDLGLDMHTDDSDVTFNVCLGVEFKGAGLQFCGHMGAANHRKHTYCYQHAKGRCVFHLGRKRHGADDISEGERLNMILWNHSSAYRESAEYTDPDYHTEEGPPDGVCVSYTHDRDYGNFKEYPKGKEKFKGRGWCPPRQYEYDNFKADCDHEVIAS
mmetsp:Transcript_40135/g.92223  ORF Transcript_40135/g.92223 Transcript_40135/m.92223 type:complete len:504 (+) Transcript_40135:41-1552(+)